MLRNYRVVGSRLFACIIQSHFISIVTLYNILSTEGHFLYLELHLTALYLVLDNAFLVDTYLNLQHTYLVYLGTSAFVITIRVY